MSDPHLSTSQRGAAEREVRALIAQSNQRSRQTFKIPERVVWAKTLKQVEAIMGGWSEDKLRLENMFEQLDLPPYVQPLRWGNSLEIFEQIHTQPPTNNTPFAINTSVSISSSFARLPITRRSMIPGSALSFWVFYDRLLIVDWPQVFLDGEKRLHKDGGEAVVWPHASPQYFWHGVELASRYGTVNSELWHPEWVFEEPNQEVRRCLIQGIGYERLISGMKMQTLHQEKDLTLLKAEKRFDQADAVFLKCCCPSTGRMYLLRVPPQMTQCEEARRWTLSSYTLELISET